MISNWNRACDGSLHTSIVLDDVADDTDDTDEDIIDNDSISCFENGDVDNISSNGVLLVGFLEVSSGSDDDEDDGDFDEDEGAVDKTSVFEDEDDVVEVCDILDVHASPKSTDASLSPKLLPCMSSLSS
jgi:hypothetical protein